MVMTDILLSVILLSVGITVLIIIHLCVVPAIRSGVGNQGDGGDDRGIIHRPGNETTSSLSVEDLKMIPSFDCKEGEKTEASAVDCAVCLDGFKVGDKCRLLPTCHHCFHLQCVDLWLMKTPFCPICRAIVRPMKLTSKVGDQSNGSGLEVDELA